MDEDASTLRDETDLMRQVFAYAQRFRGSTFVFMIGARLVDVPSFPGLVRDLALLQENGIRIVLVPSGGARIDELLSIYGIETGKVDGIRISTSEAMPLIQMAAFDTATRLMNQLARNGVEAVMGNWVRARAYGVRKGVDFQRTGLVDKVRVELLERSLEDDFVPILPCIGWSAIGEPYNISAIELATQLAIGLKARKLFFLTEGEPLSIMLLEPGREGVTMRDGCVSRMTLKAAEAAADDREASVGAPERDMLRHAVEAVRGGVERVHFIDGDMEGGVLKEIFSTVGYGIMVHDDPFENIRPMRVEDIPDVLRIMETWIEQGVLVRRTEADLQRKLADFSVYVADGTVRGCGALHRYGPEKAEIAGIAVDEKFGHGGIGRKIVLYLIEEARRKGLSGVFLLTTRTADWFQKLGFQPATVDDLPEERRAIYDTARKSRIYTYPLT